jgi:hypothetical protein
MTQAEIADQKNDYAGNRDRYGSPRKAYNKEEDATETKRTADIYQNVTAAI